MNFMFEKMIFIQSLSWEIQRDSFQSFGCQKPFGCKEVREIPVKIFSLEESFLSLFIVKAFDSNEY